MKGSGGKGTDGQDDTGSHGDRSGGRSVSDRRQRFSDGHQESRRDRVSDGWGPINGWGEARRCVGIAASSCGEKDHANWQPETASESAENSVV